MSLKATHALPTPTALALRLGWDQTRLLYSAQAVAPIIVVVVAIGCCCCCWCCYCCCCCIKPIAFCITLQGVTVADVVAVAVAAVGFRFSYRFRPIRVAVVVVVVVSGSFSLLTSESCWLWRSARCMNETAWLSLSLSVQHKLDSSKWVHTVHLTLSIGQRFCCCLTRWKTFIITRPTTTTRSTTVVKAVAIAIGTTPSGIQLSHTVQTVQMCEDRLDLPPPAQVADYLIEMIMFSIAH